MASDGRAYIITSIGSELRNVTGPDKIRQDVASFADQTFVSLVASPFAQADWLQILSLVWLSVRR